MIALVLSMAWSRRGQAFTVALLAMLGVAAAVAAPAYLRAADRAVAAGQIATATPAERGVRMSTVQQDAGGEAAPVQDVTFNDAGPALVDLPGFSYAYSAEYATIGIERDDEFRTRFVFRQQACDHLVMRSGRCLASEGDIVLGEHTADRLGLRAGDSITLSYAVFSSNPDVRKYVARGAPKKFFVAGIYHVADPGDAYWGTHGYFAADPGGWPGEPAFVGNPTMVAMDRGSVQLFIDGIAGPDALDVDGLPALRSGLASLQRAIQAANGGVTLSTALPDLLDRIDAGRSSAHLIVPVLAVPLIVLACLTIFLAVSSGMDARRPELAVVALRGARRGQRWWLATGESLVAIVAGAVAGCFAGQLLVNALTAERFPGLGADPGLASLKYAPLATLAAALTAVIAAQRHVRTPAATLIRSASGGSGVAGTIVLDIALALLAAAAGTQLAVSGGTLTGVGTFAAALILIALSRLAAWALLPAASWYAARSLRRGRLGAALAGYHLSRRPGAARLFALVTAAVAIAGYAACANGTAARDREVQAGLGTGADRVLTVADVTRRQLLTAVRTADPSGAYAMAVMSFPDTPALAVDTTRLATVPTWPAGAPAPKTVAAALHPQSAPPITLTGADVVLEVTAAGFPAGQSPRLSVTFDDSVVTVGSMLPGRHTYRERVSACTDGCRLSVMKIVGSYGTLDTAGTLTVKLPGVSALGPWRSSEGGSVTVGADSLRIGVQGLAGLPNGVRIRPADTPYPLPVAVAGRSPGPTLPGLDGNTFPITPRATLPVIPGLGATGTLTDLEYADRLAVDPDTTARAQVWLSASAPAGIKAELQDAGIAVTADIRQSEVRTQLGNEGPAVALEFALLAGILAALLAAGALILGSTVDRADLAALRVQGLSRAGLRAVTLWAYPLLVVAAVLTGTGIALLTWQLTGWALPLAESAFPLPHWPGFTVVALTALAAGLLLTATAALTSRRRNA
ncbi:hypothetical protein GCM10010435_57430 [Winogradskya consettensis]|uniref:ABC3 transporter permease C-terminal domain-containing protein n=1 Tax=Winogradskya consettensis TaxID=113560 RepID=A0A919S979_9ACTN|nr:FtsX-like permease family protein [Actinoplanes consettensis]GIM67130.1 hypothetical protein Aco04nite_04890 [Actinoplanes consettensis]